MSVLCAGGDPGDPRGWHAPGRYRSRGAGGSTPSVGFPERGRPTMQRRKMLAALGSGAIGGATAVSTGAFTSARANRSVSVETVSDNDAYLALDASVSPQAEETAGTV